MLTSQQQEVDAAAAVVREFLDEPPRVAVILGTGLSRFGEQIERPRQLSFRQIPGFPLTTALSHHGELLAGRISGVPVAVMNGRVHVYEGYSMRQITLPVHVLQAVGANVLIVSNASGGIRGDLRLGDVLMIVDQINLMWDHPRRVGPHRAEFRPLDLSQPFDADLMQAARTSARRHAIHLAEGVYAAMTGPTYETRAEYRMLRRLGADVVGMSTVPEVLVANSLGMRVLALSAVTNVCDPDCLQPTSGDLVVRAAESTEPKMRDIVSDVIRSLN